MSIFKNVLHKLLGKTSNKHPIKHVEGAEMVLVDSSVFCCPVCYDVYSSVPSILQCGHTFCNPCIRSICYQEFASRQGFNRERVFLCPVCRASCSTEHIVKNYLIEDLISKIDQLPLNNETLEEHKVSTLRFSLQRQQQRCAEMEQHVNQLNNAIMKRDKQEKHRNVLIVVGFLVYLILAQLFLK